MAKGKKKQADAPVVEAVEEQLLEVQEDSVEVQDLPDSKEVEDKKPSKLVNVKFPVTTYFKEKLEAKQVYSLTQSEFKELQKTSLRYQVV